MAADNEVEGLSTLLDLDGQVYVIKKYWTKIEARQVTKSANRPHGIKYSLTLHDRNNTRIIGYDNAHNIKKKGRRPKKYTGRIVTWDHIHKKEKVERYLFTTAHQLLGDFWGTVNKIIYG